MNTSAAATGPSGKNGCGAYYDSCTTWKLIKASIHVMSSSAGSKHPTLQPCVKDTYRTKPLTEIIQINSFLQSQTQRNNNPTVIKFRACVSGLGC